MRSDAPTVGLVAAVHSAIDALATWTSTARDHATSRVWRVEWPGGVVFVKQHAQARKRRQEVGALREWTPALVAAGHAAPLLVAEIPAEEALVMTAVPGAEADRVAPADPVGAWGLAGAFLAALHALPHDDADPMPLATAIPARAESWRARLEGRVDAGLLRAALDRLTGDAFARAQRVPCHRDFQPRNWLVDGAALAVVDWEHAAPDAAEADLVRLAATWDDAPATRDAFLDGYGGLDAAGAERLGRLLVLHGLGTLAWALDHHDPPFEAAGRAILARALQERVSRS